MDAEQGAAEPQGRDELDMVIVGAGFAGLYMLLTARRLGLRARVFDAADGVGGTWYWNRYPGARCDVPSMEYSFGFDDDLQQEWEWTERYATQPEILRYLDHVADRFDLRRDIELRTRVTAARFDDDGQRWEVDIEGPDGAGGVTARFLVMATGCLSAANLPDIPGRDEFAGRVFHTGRWPHEEVDFTGRRVAVVGTGSSGVQSIPRIAEQADHLTVFQRTPCYSVPAHNRPLDPAEVAEIKADYRHWRAGARNTNAGFGGQLNAQRQPAPALSVGDEERRRTYDDYWEIGGLAFLSSFSDLLHDRAANETAAEFVRERIRATVHDPATAERLSPDTIIGCKRMCVDTDYYATYNRPNVSLVDVGEGGISRITSEGIDVDGTVHEVDDIVFATGFDAMTGALDRIDIRGRDGLTLKEKWAAGPRTYLGLQTRGFPNLFTITGPGSPSVLTNMVASIEQHVEWIRDLVAHMEAEGIDTVEPEAEAEDGWVDYVNAVAEATLFHGCSSWYLGANVPGKPRVFMPLPGLPAYAARCDEVAAAGYEGFELA